MTPHTAPMPAPDDKGPDIAIKPPYRGPHTRTVFLGGIFTLMLLAACVAAREIIIPFILAFMIKMVLYPVMRGFARLHLPRALGAFLVIGMLLGAGTGLAVALSGPAAEWAQQVPKALPKLQARLHDFSNPIEPIQRVLNDAQSLTVSEAGQKTTVVTVRPEPLPERFMASAWYVAAGLLTTVVILFFLLVSGDTFLRRLVEILPRFTDKKQAITISNQIEKDISAYLATITLMNAAVGAATAGIMYAFGVGDPVLWGIVAFLLNYIPIAGPILGMGLFALVGMMSEASLLAALLPAGLYLGVHALESQFITPMLLARHFTLNPVLVILGLIFFYWMWGIPGAILSTPILAVFKVVCDNVQRLKPLGHFIEG